MTIYFARNTDASFDTTGFDLIWNDDFDGNQGDQPAAQWFQFDGNDDPQKRHLDAYYDAGDAYLDGDGNLRMRLRYSVGKLYLPFIQTYDWPAPKSQWTTFDQGRGRYFECRAKLSGFTVGGPWWAFSLFAPENTYDGDLTNGVEINVAESFATLGVRGSAYSSNPNGFSKSLNTAVHAGDPVGSNSVATELLALGIDIRDGEFHNIGAYWDDTVVEYWCDGIKYREITTDVPTGGQHALVLSLEYDAWNGTDNSDEWDQRELIEDYVAQLPQFIDVAHVRVYEKQPAAIVGVPVIIDTDVSADVNDMAALAVANRLMQLGECSILCMGHCSWHSRGVQAMSVVNDFYGHPSIPIGSQNKGVNDIETPTDTGYATYISGAFMPTQFSHSAVPTNQLYRQTLAQQADNSVVFVTIGPLNNIKDLLDSPADGFSGLTGEQLFNQKVLRMHVTGGEYPARDPGDGAEGNFGDSGAGVAADVFSRVTVPVYFTGYEVGLDTNGFGSGPILQTEPASNPVAEAYKYFYLNPPPEVNGGVAGPILDHSTWDIITAYTAIRGYPGYFTLVESGFNDIASDGVNTWMGAPDSSQAYLVEFLDPQTFVETYLEPLMLPSGSVLPNTSQPTIEAITAKVTDSNVMTNDAFSHTQTAGNKLLVITASLVRDSTNQDATITYNGASADTEGNYHNSAPSWNKPQIGYALFDNPASGANTVSVSWSGDVRRTTTYAIDLNYAGSLAATADNGGVWGTSVNHNISIGSAESLLILVAAANDCTVFSGLTATDMTTERYDETNGTDNTGLCLGLAYEIDPDTGTKGIVAGFTNTGSDWVHGASFVISPNS